MKNSNQSESAAEPSRKELVLASTLSFLLPFSVYWRGLMPGLAIEGDSGEIITVLKEFGVLHSPGFPGYVVLAKIWTLLLWWVDIAYAANLFSALCGALSSYWIFRLGRRFGLCWSALALALGFAFSIEFWYASLATEVYTLAILSLLIVLEALLALDPKKPKTALRLGFFMGLGFSIHVYSWALFPVILFFALKRLWGSPGRLKLIGRKAVGFLIGLSPYLYIPLRAGRTKFVNEGGIDGFGRFFDHITWNLQRERIEEATRLNLGEWLSIKLQQLQFFGQELLLQWGALGLALILAFIVQAFYLYKKSGKTWSLDQTQFARIVAASLLLMPGVVWLVFTGDSLNIGLLSEMAVHMQTLYVLMCLAAMIACWKYAQESRPANVLILLPIFLLVQRWPDMDLSRNRIAVDHAHDLIDHLPANSIILGDNDNDLMTITFEMAVRGARADVVLLNLMNGTEWNYDNYRKLYPDLMWPGYSRLYYGQLVPMNFSKRPVYFSSWTAAAGYLKVSRQTDQFQIVPRDGAYRLVENAKDHVEGVARQEISFRIFEIPTDFHLRDREVDVIATRAEYFMHQAIFLARHGRTQEAKRAITLAFKLPTLNQGKYGQALIKDLQKILASLPE